MGWKDGRNYERATNFTQEQLLEICPHHIVRHMSLLAYGVEAPEDDGRPTHRRASGLEFQKKAISFFMPNQNAKWNVESETGNPTMSVAVNALIKRIKKDEVRKRGKKSNAKRDLKRTEFRKTLRLLEACDTHQRKHRIPCMMKLQFHIIGRADDLSNLETEDLRQHDKFKAFALQTKVSYRRMFLRKVFVLIKYCLALWIPTSAFYSHLVATWNLASPRFYRDLMAEGFCLVRAMTMMRLFGSMNDTSERSGPYGSTMR